MEKKNEKTKPNVEEISINEDMDDTDVIKYLLSSQFEDEKI